LLGLGRSRRTRIILTSLAAGLAASVASTRVLLGVHWLTDVLAGLVLGWSWFGLCSLAFGGRLLRFGAPAETAQRAAGGDRRL
jgi:undecaprenyl-diphosphatase